MRTPPSSLCEETAPGQTGFLIPTITTVPNPDSWAHKVRYSQYKPVEQVGISRSAPQVEKLAVVPTFRSPYGLCTANYIIHSPQQARLVTLHFDRAIYSQESWLMRLLIYFELKVVQLRRCHFRFSGRPGELWEIIVLQVLNSLSNLQRLEGDSKSSRSRRKKT